MADKIRLIFVTYLKRWCCNPIDFFFFFFFYDSKKTLYLHQLLYSHFMTTLPTGYSNHTRPPFSHLLTLYLNPTMTSGHCFPILKNKQTNKLNQTNKPNTHHPSLFPSILGKGFDWEGYGFLLWIQRIYFLWFDNKRFQDALC